MSDYLASMVNSELVGKVAKLAKKRSWACSDPPYRNTTRPSRSLLYARSADGGAARIRGLVFLEFIEHQGSWT